MNGLFIKTIPEIIWDIVSKFIDWPPIKKIQFVILILIITPGIAYYTIIQQSVRYAFLCIAFFFVLSIINLAYVISINKAKRKNKSKHALLIADVVSFGIFPSYIFINTLIDYFVIKLLINIFWEVSSLSIFWGIAIFSFFLKIIDIVLYKNKVTKKALPNVCISYAYSLYKKALKTKKVKK